MLRLAFACAAVGAAPILHACDMCGVYSGPRAEYLEPGPYVGLSEQFTHFHTLREDGERVPNDLDQRMDSSITQLLVGWRIVPWLSVQVTVPYIRRSFDRPEDLEIEHGVESGLGDIVLTGQYVAWQEMRESRAARATLLAGVKAPTGSSDRLQEEEDEVTNPSSPGAPESGVHGHDLALGSGSWDAVVGGAIYARWGEWFVAAQLQYAIRTEGDHQYRYANDLTWSAGPGVYAWREPGNSVALQALLSGDHKGKDTFAGEKAEDTGMNALWIGPSAGIEWGDRLHAELGLDLPVVQNNTALQLVPDWRARASASWQF